MSYMKTEFDKILAQYGHLVYLQRVTTNVYGEKHYDQEVEIHLTRHRGANSALPDIAQEQPEGDVSTSERIYYFRSEVNPFEGDRIYEQDPRVPQTVWAIDAALPLRGLRGDIDYWVVGATRVRPN